MVVTCGGFWLGIVHPEPTASPDGKYCSKLLFIGVNSESFGYSITEGVLGAKPPEPMITAGSSEGGRERLGSNKIVLRSKTSLFGKGNLMF